MERDPTTGLYRLGINMLHMAYLTLEQNDLRHIAHPFLRRLKDQFKETVNLSILDDADVVFLEVIESPQRVKLAAATGQRLPAFCTASGKAYLAFVSNDVLHDVLDQGMPPQTEFTITDRNEFFKDMRGIQERGFAVSMQEYEEGINAVAAPILIADNRPIASLAVAGPSFRLTEELMHQIGPVLVKTAQVIAQEYEFVPNEE